MILPKTRNNAALVLAVLALGALSGFAPAVWDGTLVQYGSMREAVGQQHDQGRVALSTLTDKQNFFGVAALEGLEGEITIFDSDAIVTGVAGEGTLEPVPNKDLQATMLVGAYIPAWTEYEVDHDVPAAGFDDMVRDAAGKSGVDVSKPFMFTMEGEFSDVRMHVIHGACPIHARMKNIQLPKEEAPFEGQYPTIRGRLVGVYASNSVGVLTHPDTSTHVHLIFEDAASGKQVTAHIEQIGLVTGAVLKLPTSQ
jgi:alpha-acetolactate decarboxylase